MAGGAAPRPPSLSYQLLTFALPPGPLRETICADLEDEFERLVEQRSVARARAWYRRQVRRIVFSYAIPSRLRLLFGLPAPGDRRADTPADPGGRVDPFDGLWLDLKIAVRGLLRNPGFAAVAILTLAIAIGTNTAVFSVVDSVLLRPLPYGDPERLVTLYQSLPRPGLERTKPGPGTIRDWQERSSAFTGIAVWRSNAATLLADGEPVRVLTASVSPNFFEILDVDAAVGRTFRADDATSDGAGAVVLSHALWLRVFGGTTDVVGRTVRLNDKTLRIVGVAPVDFFFFRDTVVGEGSNGRSTELWTTDPAGPLAPVTGEPAQLGVVARLRPELTLGQAQAGMDTIAEALVEEYPQRYTWPNGETLGTRVESLHGAMVYGSGRSFAVLAAAGAVLLLIACVNVANLMLARADARRREVSLRAAIGAGRARLLRQLMTESLLLSTVAGLAGVLLAHWAIRLVHVVAPGTNGGNLVPLLERAELDLRVLCAAAGIAAATAAAYGIAPALRLTRIDPGAGLRAVPRTGGRRLWGRQLVLAGEIALALVLLIGVGLLVATAARLNAIPLGFDPENVELMTVELPLIRYAAQQDGPGGRGSWSLRPEYYDLVDVLVDRLGALPAVEAAGAVNMIPLGSGFQVLAVHVEGSERSHPMGELDGVPISDDPLMKTVTPDYFRALGIPLLRGRAFSPADGASAPPVVIVNEAFVDYHSLGDGALGREILVRDGPEWRPATIVGIVGNVFEFDYTQILLESGENVGPNVYLPYRQLAPTVGSVVRARRQASVTVAARYHGAETEVAAAMRKIFAELDSETAIVALHSMESHIARRLADRRVYRTLMGVLATVSLTLALVGVYSVMAFDIARRTHEVGVRMALGARAAAVVRMIVGEGFRVALLGTLVGVLGALATTRLLESWLYEVSPTEPLVFFTLATVVVPVALLACWIPARRAARVDPIAALRAE